jgi:D-alanyl-D-alanine carboxypeptidase
MTSRLGGNARLGLLIGLMLLALACAQRLAAAPYAAMVVDARSGEIIHSENADTRLHPASLTKMMTLYVAFQAVARGEISLDTEVRISAKAANEAPSRLGLREGQTIRLRFLLRAAAVRSANDAATAIGEALSGSEAAFADRMNATAAAMGMRNTRFRNMHGLTEEGHYSTAHDMTILGRHLIYDFPQYYNLFSRRTADAGVAEVTNTNKRFLDAYPGADGIKTGFTNAAGYNLVASAERGSVRIIATVFGGNSTASRNARVAELLDMGFARARADVALRPPTGVASVETASAAAAPAPAPAAEASPAVQGSALVTVSLRPKARPAVRVAVAASQAVPSSEDAVIAEVIESVLAQALDVGATEDSDPAPEAVLTELAFLPASDAQPETLQALAGTQVERLQNEIDSGIVAPEERPAEIIMTAAAIAPAEVAEQAPVEVVTRVSTSGGRHWAISLGSHASHGAAERFLLQAAIAEAGSLDGALRRIERRSGGYEATFVGLTRDQADLACRRFVARGTECETLGEGQ